MDGSDREFYSIRTILNNFNAPLNEEQAWAICYQCAKHYNAGGRDESGFYQRFGSFCESKSLDHVFLRRDGELTIGLSENKTQLDDEDSMKHAAHRESEFLEAVGFITYKALDHGLTDVEERCLSPGLEDMIYKLTSGSSCTDSDNDEGIGHETNSGISSCQELLQVCSRRLEAPMQAADHYKAVCRALVAEADELTSFLQKISQGQQLVSGEEEKSQLEELDKMDWARLWMQVLGGLRHGVKLKKIEQPNTRASEFELTPYEMLMEDIRSRRYTLNKVTVEDHIPVTVKKSAHDLILDFIRSRPPLNPAQSRRLRSPPAASPGVREQLLDAIRNDSGRHLKPVENNRYVETSRTRQFEDSVSPTPTKKIIKADLSLFQSHSDEETCVSDDDFDEVDFTTDDEVFTSRQKVTPQSLEPFTPLDSPPMPWQRRVNTDLVVNTNSDGGRKKERRHSITVCESPAPFKHSDDEKTNKTAQAKLNDPLQCMSLTVEEVMHIRSVLTKAELECLITDPQLHDLISRGKVCFSCKKVKFSIFGQWANKCKFCKRAVCSYCIRKMGIPSDRFQNVPVYTLSPSPLSPGSEKSILKLGKAGSAPSSPRTGVNIVTRPPEGGARDRTPPDQRESKLSELQGPQMSICKDCKVMIVNIIRASRSTLLKAKRDQRMKAQARQDFITGRPSRNFHLNLKPVYRA